MPTDRRVHEPIFAATVAAAALLVAGFGCTRRGPPEPVAAPSEPTFAEQADAVRAGRSEQIRVDQALVTDEQLVELDGLEDKLRRLNLSKTTITDEGLARIAGLRRLEQLRLASSAITDAGLADLAQLSKLRHLHLIDAPVTDAGLEHLRPLTGLKSLYLDGSRASDEGMNRLVEALPDVHLHFDGGHHRHDMHADDHQREEDPSGPAGGA